MKTIIRKIKRLFNPLFGNVTEKLRTAGFKSYCHNRGGVRSFRYDRIVSLNKA